LIISLIAAMDEQNGIGRDGGLPWHLSDDLKNFRRLTMGHHLIMGRKTFESIGVHLSGRQSIVLSRDADYVAEKAILAHSIEDALKLAREAGEEEVFVIGGAQIFALALPMAERFYLTRVHAEVDVDTQFPEFDENDWLELERIEFGKGLKNEHPYTILSLQKRQLS